MLPRWSIRWGEGGVRIAGRGGRWVRAVGDREARTVTGKLCVINNIIICSYREPYWREARQKNNSTTDAHRCTVPLQRSHSTRQDGVGPGSALPFGASACICG